MHCTHTQVTKNQAHTFSFESCNIILKLEVLVHPQVHFIFILLDINGMGTFLENVNNLAMRMKDGLLLSTYLYIHVVQGREGFPL